MSDIDLYDLGTAQTAAHQAQITLRLAEQKRLERIATDIQKTTLDSLGQVQIHLEKLEGDMTTLREEMRNLAQRIQEKIDIGFEIGFAQSVKKEGLIRDLIDQHQLLAARIIQSAQAGKVPDKDVIDQYTHIGQQLITQTQVTA